MVVCMQKVQKFLSKYKQHKVKPFLLLASNLSKVLSFVSVKLMEEGAWISVKVL